MSTGRTLRDVADATVGFVGKMTPHYRDEGVTFLRSQDILPHRIEASTALRVDPAFEATIQKSRLRVGDVVVVRTGKPGTSAVVSLDLEGANCSDLVVIRPGTDVDSRWLSYYINAAAQGFIRGRLVGAVQQHFNVKSALEMPIPELSLDTQQAQVELLGALDDKIAANGLATKVSDELLRTLYDRLPLSSVTLGQVAVNVRRSVEPAGIAADEMHVGLEHLSRRSIWLESRGVGADVASSKSRLNCGDTLFGKLRPYFHKVALAPSGGVCSTDILVIRPRESENVALVAAAASSDVIVASAVQASNGTRMPRAKWTDIARCSVPDPETDCVREFCAVADPVIKRSAQAIEENLRLDATRDELLPLLMSGKITVKDAEKTVEEVV
ncbi:restriction endonuclease subunit S [Brachybacterium tyrofermentans]|uniref:restriction endonuclease subunit S n=1 Tax=Brachybacterium tyrofermentans TaxID=47848 RepID=UPI003FD2EF59